MRRERGAVIVWAMVFVIVVTALLGIAASQEARVSESLLRAVREEDARLEAAGGLRWGAARLARDGKLEELLRRDPDGELRVTLEGDRIVSVYRAAFGGRREAVRSVSARWSGGRLVDWREE